MLRQYLQRRRFFHSAMLAWVSIALALAHRPIKPAVLAIVGCMRMLLRLRLSALDLLIGYLIDLIIIHALTIRHR